jgi:8-oxo-dGTP pyrophosphatase MutT (NUDIX family)
MEERPQPHPASWRTLSSRPLADCRVFRVDIERAENPQTGQSGDFSIIRAPDWVVALASPEPGKFLMVEQYRFGAHRLSLEFPAGCLEKGEDIVTGAARELAEETGYEPTLPGRVIGSFLPNPALQDNTCHVVLFGKVEKAGKAHPDELEELALSLRDLGEIRALALSGGIVHGMAHAALFFLDAGKSSFNLD